MLVKNEGVTNPKQIFTTTFDLYFLTIKSHRLLSNGDWERYDFYMDITKEYPEICTDSIDIFWMIVVNHSVFPILLSTKMQTNC